MSKPKTVRVRIAVGVSDGGEWCASGASTASEGRSAEEAFIFLPKPEGQQALVWVEADVPIPEEVTVEGEVRDD